jgi:hypothetical protein
MTTPLALSCSTAGTRRAPGSSTPRRGWAPSSLPGPGDTFTYTPPAAETRLVTFSGSILVTYSGSESTFSSWWAHHKILATSTGSATGTVEVRPHNLTSGGANFGVFLQPAS